MRNLKKFLALVLAVMMAASLMVTANAAITTDPAMTDSDKVTEEFKEAVAVLNGLKIITGYEDGSFQPQKDISRQETTALVYRLHSGDVKDDKKDLYSTADNIKQFTDVNREGAQKWSAGYIGYCANQGIIKGVSDTRFAPTSKVTGYQVLAMVLRAIGYGQNKEYEGSGWQTRVATTATQLQLLRNINDTNYSATLSAPATRELVAEIIFQAALQPTVTYTPGLGYVPTGSALGGLVGGAYGSLSEKNFNLRISGWETVGKWGRPGYRWMNGTKTVATITYEPVKTYTDVQRECDVAHDLGIEASKDFHLFVNGKTELTNAYRITATDTVTKVGGNGRLTEIFTGYSRPWNVTDDGRVVAGGSNGPDTVVMMDTMLAKVVSTTEAVLDKAGHVITPAKMTVNVYGTNHNYNTPTQRTISKSATDASNWDYSRGSVILLNAYTDHTARAGQIDKEKAAYETDEPVATLKQGENLFIIDPPKSVTGKQTLVYWNEDKHQVAGEDKTDALTLDLDAAGTNINTTYVWYFDQYGYLIGIDEVANQRYGVITSVYASFGQGETSTDGNAKAIATVLYADGTTGTEEIDYFMSSTNTGVTRQTTISTQMHDGSVSGKTASSESQIWPVYDMGTNKPMKEELLSAALPNTTLKPALTASANQGVVYMSPIASLNSNSAKDGDANNLLGILNNNLFKFVKTGEDKTMAIEVAGGDTTYTGPSQNTGRYADHWAAVTDTTNGGRLYKNLAYLALDSTSNANTSIAAWLDNETQIIFRDEATGKITVYKGVSALPGDIVIPKADKTGKDACNANEIDWADTDGDGRAEVMYLTGTIDGQVTYGLFYYNGGASNWNGTTGTAAGWLNGVQTTLTFDDLEMLNLIRNARTADGKEGYDAHLFAVKQFNGVVVDVMGRDDTTQSPNLLMDHKAVGDMYDGSVAGHYNVPTETITIFQTNIKPAAGAGAAGDKFEYGADEPKWGNPYNATTEAVYYKDSKDGAQDLTYVPNAIGGRVEVRNKGTASTAAADATYFVNPNTKIFGIGSGVTEGTAALAYLNEYDLNDVTIVYQAGGSILEIYVAIDPDNTPSNRPGGNTENTMAPSGPNVVPLKGTDFASETALNAFLKSAAALKNHVYYCKDLKWSANPTDESSTADQLLYFPFTATANSNTISLNVWDKYNNIMWSETPTSTSLNANDHARFVINFKDNTKVATDGSVAVAKVFPAGDYTFTIVDNAGVILSQGSFTIS